VNSIISKKAETKKYSQAHTEVNVNTVNSPLGANLFSPLTLQGGTNNFNRIGHKVSPVGIDIRGHFYNNTASQQNFIKMVVFRKKNMAAAPLFDLLELNTGDAQVSNLSMQKMYSRFNTDDYQILKTKMFIMGNDTGAQETRMFKCWVPLKGQLTYEGNGNISPTYNDIQIIFYSSEADGDEGALGNNVELTFNSTFYFKDM